MHQSKKNCFDWSFQADVYASEHRQPSKPKIIVTQHSMFLWTTCTHSTNIRQSLFLQQTLLHTLKRAAASTSLGPADLADPCRQKFFSKKKKNQSVRKTDIFRSHSGGLKARLFLRRYQHSDFSQLVVVVVLMQSTVPKDYLFY